MLHTDRQEVLSGHAVAAAQGWPGAECPAALSPKPGMRLYRIGGKYMLVDTSESDANMADVYSMNETAALLWETVGTGCGLSPDALADSLCRVYDVGHDRAAGDVRRQLDEWAAMGLLVRKPAERLKP